TPRSSREFFTSCKVLSVTIYYLLIERWSEQGSDHSRQHDYYNVWDNSIDRTELVFSIPAQIHLITTCYGVLLEVEVVSDFLEEPWY
ncbi:MAG: hypothetical protein VX749_06060, partial [Pseudomonadota bacterium]|nr:hypothetical protein [Pseudomonadota bacterium]